MNGSNLYLVNEINKRLDYERIRAVAPIFRLYCLQDVLHNVKEQLDIIRMQEQQENNNKNNINYCKMYDWLIEFTNFDS